MSRLDAELAIRGLAQSRTRATVLIAEGKVLVDGKTITKASFPVAPESVIELSQADLWVARSAHKLVHALEVFQIDPKGKSAIDLGASTGGFSQVLLVQGASKVLAIDVGHDQLVPELREHPQLINLEGTNVRFLTPEIIEHHLPRRAELIVADLSFISLTTIAKVLPTLISASADLVLLVKPQFEVGRTGIKKGIAKVELVPEAVLRVMDSMMNVGFAIQGFDLSPIQGSFGNQEYLLWLKPGDNNLAQWLDRILEIVGGKNA